MPNVEIDGVGVVEFPDTMSADEISSVSSKLYNSKASKTASVEQSVVENVPATLRARAKEGRGLPSSSLNIIKKALSQNAVKFTRGLNISPGDLSILAGEKPEPEPLSPTQQGLVGIGEKALEALKNVPADIPRTAVDIAKGVYGLGKGLYETAEGTVQGLVEGKPGFQAT